MEFFQENWLQILVAIYLLGMILHGHYRGFIRLAVSFTALIITLIIVHIALPHVTAYVSENTAFREKIGSSILQTVGIDSIEKDSEDFFGKSQYTLPDEQRLIIEGLNLPNSVKEALITNNNHEIYQVLGVNAFADYISAYLSQAIIQSVCFILLFIIVFISVQIVVRWLDLIAKLPIINGINQLAGAVLGGVQGLLYLWIGCIVLSAFTSTPFGLAVMEQIEKSTWLYILYHNNFLSALMIGVAKSIF